MDEQTKIILFAALIIGIIVYRLHFSRKAVVTNKLRETRSKKIALVKNDEIVKINGKIKFFGKPLIAPLSGRRCSYYYVLVEKKGSRGNWGHFFDEEVIGKIIIGW